MWCLFPQLGTYAFPALERFLKLRCAPLLGLSALDSLRPYFPQFKMQTGREEFSAFWPKWNSGPSTPWS